MTNIGNVILEKSPNPQEIAEVGSAVRELIIFDPLGAGEFS